MEAQRWGRPLAGFPTHVQVPYTALMGARVVRRAVCALVMLPVLWPAAASGQRARISPHEQHEFVLGEARISFDYGRPSKRGREIWGALVPWGRWWMPGADEATILTTDAPIVLGEALAVPAGQHTIYMLPDPERSKLIVNNQVGQFHTAYDPRLDLGRVDLTLRRLSEPVEQLTFSVEPRPDGRGLFKLTWDDREYSVTVTAGKQGSGQAARPVTESWLGR